MTLVPSFLALLQFLAAVMTAPSFANFTIILTGWGIAPRRTVTGMIVASRMAGTRHYSIFHRFFARARWSPNAQGWRCFNHFLSTCATLPERVAGNRSLGAHRSTQAYLDLGYVHQRHIVMRPFATSKRLGHKPLLHRPTAPLLSKDLSAVCLAIAPTVGMAELRNASL